jgi:hypothetical protein
MDYNGRISVPKILISFLETEGTLRSLVYKIPTIINRLAVSRSQLLIKHVQLIIDLSAEYAEEITLRSAERVN